MPAPRSVAISLALLCILAGCRTEIPELAREEQFSIGLGRLEDQIDLFQLQGRRLTSETSLYMRNGTFYLSNGGGAKVMGFSSYGDLLLLLYDPSMNPDPVGLSVVGEGSDVASTRRAVRHALPDIGEIAVDGGETLYVAARASATLVVATEAHGVGREAIILRFDREGRALPYLGSDGVGGTPFPPIENMELTAHDDLVVVTRTQEARIVYWFSSDGTPRYESVLTEKQLPPGRTAGSSPTIQTVHPSQSRPALHLLVDYFRETIDKSTQAVTAVIAQNSVLYRLDLETARFDRSFELPAVKPRKTQYGGREVEIPGSRYQFLGMVEQGFAFFMRPEASGIYEVAMVDEQGKLAERRRVLIDEQGLTYMTLHLSSRGILSALLCDATKASIVWWRCDRVLSPPSR